jgi:hypothetical protein
MLAGIASNDTKSEITSSPVGGGHTARGDIKSVEKFETACGSGRLKLDIDTPLQLTINPPLPQAVSDF